jgi:septum formation protein
MGPSKPRIILASESPRRSALLKSLGIKFSVMPSNADERSTGAENPGSYVKRVASLKAESVSARVKRGIIIGADTVVVINKKIIGKPKDERDAFVTLKLLSGKTHTVMTGVCVINKYSGKRRVIVVSTKVRFRRLGNRIIRWYLNTGEPMGKAGSYAIQGKGSVLVNSIQGDYNNIVGLPLAALAEVLSEMGVLHSAGA